MTWKRRTLAVLCFAVMALGFHANGGVYVTPHNIIVLFAFIGPPTILGLYCRLGRKARSRLNPPVTILFRHDVQRPISPDRFIVGISSLKFGINVHFGVRR